MPDPAARKEPPINPTSGAPKGTAARRRADQRGTALVEFALFFPLVALICLGTVDLGRAYTTVNQVKNAAREGAAYAQLHPAQQTAVAGTGCADPNNITWRARNEAASAGTSFAVTITPAIAGCSASSAPASGSDMTVTVSKGFTILTPLVRVVTGNAVIRSSVTVKVQ